MSVRSWLFLGLIVALAAACGDDTDAPPPVMGPDLPQAQVGNLIDMCSGDDCQLIDPATAAPADFSCAGSASAPADDGAMISFTLTIRDFQEDNLVPDVCVKFYPDNVVADETCDPATDLVTDDMGQVTVMDNAGSWYAYRVYDKLGPTPATTIVGSVQYNEAGPSMEGGDVEGNSVSSATINLIPTVLGFRREMGTAVLAGTITDCGDDNVYGTHIRMYTPDGTLVAEGMPSSAPHYRYFDGDDFPNSTQPWSHVDGLFAAANLPVPPDGQPIFLELIGRLTPDGPIEVLGCERGRLFPDTVTILNMGPKRVDGPTCPGEM